MTALLNADQVTEPGWYWWKAPGGRFAPILVEPCPVRRTVMTFSPFPGEAAHVNLYGEFVKTAPPDEPAAPAEDLPRLDAPISELVGVLAGSVIPPAERAVAALDAVTAAAIRARAAVAAIGMLPGFEVLGMIETTSSDPAAPPPL
jgi:hypothetical protein